VVPSPEELLDEAPLATSQKSCKQKNGSRDQGPEWRNVFRWDFHLTW
jgi:hypothetical protein